MQCVEIIQLEGGEYQSCLPRVLRPDTIRFPRDFKQRVQLPCRRAEPFGVYREVDTERVAAMMLHPNPVKDSMLVGRKSNQREIAPRNDVADTGERSGAKQERNHVKEIFMKGFKL